MVEYRGVCEVEIKPTELFSGLKEQPTVHSFPLPVSATATPTGVPDGGARTPSAKGLVVSHTAQHNFGKRHEISTESVFVAKFLFLDYISLLLSLLTSLP